MWIRIFLLFVFISIWVSGCSLGQPVSNVPTLSQPTGIQQPTPTLSEQPTIAPTKTAAIVATSPNQNSPTVQATPTSEPSRTAFPYRPQIGAPQYLPAFTQPESGCKWVGIAGQVFDSRTNPVENVTVVVKGFFDGKTIDGMTLSGLGRAYGPGGYEVKLGDKAMDTYGAVTVQLFNDKFEPLSELYPVTTYNDCQKNLIIYNFQSIMTVKNIYLPFLGN